MSPNARRSLVAAGDVIALVVFTIIGLVNHKDGVTVNGVLKVIGPILIVAVPAAFLFGTYRRPSVSSLLPTWVVSVPAGILIRKAWFDTPTTWGSTGVFIGVALAFTLVFLLVWRLLAQVLHVNTVFGEA
jgi:hypothetical protein